MTAQSQLDATLFADHTALLKVNQSLAFQKINRYQSLLDSAAQKFNIQIIKNCRDGSLMTFNNSLDAVKAAKQIQEEANQNATVLSPVGIHVGEFIIKNKKTSTTVVNAYFDEITKPKNQFRVFLSKLLTFPN